MKLFLSVDALFAELTRLRIGQQTNETSSLICSYATSAESSRRHRDGLGRLVPAECEAAETRQQQMEGK